MTEHSAEKDAPRKEWISDREYVIHDDQSDAESDKPSYHDLHVTTATIPRTSIFNLAYGYEISCNRVGGWCLWFKSQRVAGEYAEGLRLDVGGHIICDSLTRPIPPVKGDE